jgi:hypothetical protein
VKKRDRKAIETYAREAADEIGLRDWEIGFDWDRPADEGDGGSVDWVEGRKGIVIRLSENFRGYATDEQRYVICHELVHAHFAQMQDTVEEDLKPHLSRPTYDIYSRSFRRAVEYGIDAVSHARAAKLPRIEWPKGKSKD